MEHIRALVIIAAFLIYWALIYYRFHNHDYTPLSLVSAGAFLFFVGMHEFFIGKVTFFDIRWVYLVGVLFLVAAFSIVGIGAKKHGLKKQVDITLTFFNKVGGKGLMYFCLVIAFPAFFFIMAGSYYFLGQEHVFAWGMIFLAWIASSARLIKRIRKKKL